MDKWEKIFLALAAVALVGVVIFHVASGSNLTLPVADIPAPDANDLPPDLGPAYLTMNTPNFNPGPPVFNVMPKMAAAVSTQNSGGNSSCNSC